MDNQSENTSLNNSLPKNTLPKNVVKIEKVKPPFVNGPFLGTRKENEKTINHLPPRKETKVVFKNKKPWITSQYGYINREVLSAKPYF